METKEKTMTTQEVADRFYALCEQGRYDQIQDELYDDGVRSIEPVDSGWKSVVGLDNVKAKSKEWAAMIEEMHGGYTNKPEVAGNYFVCTMGMDVTTKGKERLKLDEVAVYQVKEGRIVLEHFFF